ncbi:MAG: ATP-binding protein [Candidatus Micrarchaeota archaeon]|nr:ATP-binding protein [Candidatus Micrarchaeota archaeon]
MPLSFENTSEIKIPQSPLERVIGQEHVLEIAHIVAKQRRHLLLVGPPGTGKSFIANTISSALPRPTQQVAVLGNPENPDRPILEIKTAEDIEREKKEILKARLIDPRDAPYYVSERLGFRCRKCGTISDPESNICLYCGAEKYRRNRNIEDMFSSAPRISRDDKVLMKRVTPEGKEEELTYERAGAKVKVYKNKPRALGEQQRKVLVHLDRNTFVQATGASESELLGDVRHDPYGGHKDIGIPPHERVVPGAIHEAHEGVLFIDELSTLGELQRYLLTAMQEKKFPIMGRNSTSTGAVVRVDNVPCDFILVGAVNINDVHAILPPLRSRIIGSGYEVLLNTVMPDTERNREKMVQFIAQEIAKDGRIPHASYGACMRIIDESKLRAKQMDGKDGLTLRLRDLSGIIKMAGDIAIFDGAQLIEKEHVERAIKRAQSIEEQLLDTYGSAFRAGQSDYAALSRSKSRGYASEVR